MYKRQVYSNTTPRTHRIAAALMDCGIDAAPVNKALFRTKSRTRLAMEDVYKRQGYDNGAVLLDMGGAEPLRFEKPELALVRLRVEF